MSDYNGWKNYETWCVSLWLSNEEWSQDESVRMAEAAGGDRGQLARALEAWCETFPEVEAIQSQASFVADLFGHAWGSVDWYEIADGLLEEVEVDA